MPYVPHRINRGMLSMKYNQHWRGCHASPKGAAVEVFPAKGKIKEYVQNLKESLVQKAENKK